MKTTKNASSTRRRFGAAALGLGLLFGAAACGNSAESEANDLLSQYGIDVDDFKDIDFEAEAEAWEDLADDYLKDLEG